MCYFWFILQKLYNIKSNIILFICINFMHYCYIVNVCIIGGHNDLVTSFVGIISDLDTPIDRLVVSFMSKNVFLSYLNCDSWMCCGFVLKISPPKKAELLLFNSFSLRFDVTAINVECSLILQMKHASWFNFTSLFMS